MIPYGRQNISAEDIANVVDVLESDFLTQGPAVEAFEGALTSYTGGRYAVAFSSATTALHAAYRALGLGSGDILWTSPNSFVASSNAALYCGARVDFVDINPQSYNMDVDKLEAKLQQAEKQGTLPKIVVPVHFAGQSCDMKSIRALADRYDFSIVEDASHAVGGKYQSQYVGSCEYSDITVFSFHPVKIVTTGEGGAALTNNEALYEKLNLLRSHGITRDITKMTAPSDEPWYYEQIDLGYNYRITDMQCALGKSQMSRLTEFVNRRHEIFQSYQQMLSDLPVLLPYQDDMQRSSLHLYPIQILSETENARKNVFISMRNKGIGVNVHYIPIHTQPYYKNMGFNWGDFPEAEKYYSRAISLPMFPDLSSSDQQQVVDALKTSIDEL